MSGEAHVNITNHKHMGACGPSPNGQRLWGSCGLSPNGKWLWRSCDGQRLWGACGPSPNGKWLWRSCGRTCLFFFDGRLGGGFGAELFGDGVGEDAADGDSGAHLALQ